tara:strand:- start:127 stop:300 length:174 start_codon:yes stop_codon:yes gene_type:complete
VRRSNYNERKIKMNLKKFVIKIKDLKKHTKLKSIILMKKKKRLKTELKAIGIDRKKV